MSIVPVALQVGLLIGHSSGLCFFSLNGLYINFKNTIFLVHHTEENLFVMKKKHLDNVSLSVDNQEKRLPQKDPPLLGHTLVVVEILRSNHWKI